MTWPSCNSTLEHETIQEVDLWDGGITFHNLCVIISAVCLVISAFLAGIAIFGHARHYSRPSEQRYIIRILFMIPIYTLTSFLCIYFYKWSVYFELIGYCYEPFAIASFFTLLCSYIAPELHDQKEFFRHIEPINWVWPIPWFQKCTGGQNGVWRKPRSGLTWFNVIWIGVFQYCFLRLILTILAVAAESKSLYCEDSDNIAFAHVWVLIIESIAVTIAMYCLIQFYLQTKTDIAQHRPFIKILCIKLVIFLSFWQSTIIDFLTSSGLIKSSAKVVLQDWNNALPYVLISIEMCLFALLHFWGFPWRPYIISRDNVVADSVQCYYGGKMGLKALVDAMNPWDLVKANARGLRWLFVGRKKRMADSSYDLPKRETAGESGEASSPGPQDTMREAQSSRFYRLQSN